MSEVKISPISSDFYILGEGPHWNEEDQSLLFVDILQGNVHKYYFQTQKIKTVHVENVGTDGSVSFVIPVEGTTDNFVVGLGLSLALLKWSSSEPDKQVKKPVLLHSLDATHSPRVRFNDAKCDRSGRLFAGTMDTDFGEKHDKYLGDLYTFDSNIKISHLVTNVSISNGLAWSRDSKIFYYIDSMEYRVDAFDYSIDIGTISNRRPVFDYKSHPEVKGKPDGMCIDENENLWVACFDGFQVLNIDPRTGKLIRIIDMPSRNITSCCWGGPDYSILFVTSAGRDCQNEIGAFPDTGKTFAVTGLNVKGLPPKKYKINNLSKVLKL